MADSKNSIAGGYPAPSTELSRYEIFKTAFESLGITKPELARILFLGEKPTSSTKSKIIEQLAGKEGRGISKQAALALQLLVLLQDSGYDVSQLVFQDEGWLIEKP